MSEERKPAPEDDIDPLGRILEDAEQALRPPDFEYFVKIRRLEEWLAFSVYINICLFLTLLAVLKSR